MRILVLGGTSFIGPFVVRRLVDKGHEVAVFHRGETNAPLPSSVRHIHGDHARLTDYAGEFAKFAPDVVLEMIAWSEEHGKMLVDVFAGVARRIVAISSGDVYRAYDRLRGKDLGPPDPTPLTEDSPLRDRLFPYRSLDTKPEDWAYSYEKILMERAVLGVPKTLPATILRLPMVYGPQDNQHRLFEYIKRIDDNRPFILLPEDAAGLRGLRGYVDDMGEAIALCVESEQAAGRIYHVAEQPSVTEREWLERIAAATGWGGRIVTIPNSQMPDNMRHGLDTSQDWSIDSSRIRRELGYVEPTPPDEAMRQTIEWERANPKKFDPSDFDYAAEGAAAALATD
jgi:nucleoside-diphosphate-sugar epimerase